MRRGRGSSPGARQVRPPRGSEGPLPLGMGKATPPPTGSSSTPSPQKRGSRNERDISRPHEPVWDPHTHSGSWPAARPYSKKRAARDNQTLTAQEDRARAIRRRREAPQGHPVRPPSTPVTPPRTRPPPPGPVPRRASRTTPPFIPSRPMNAGEAASSYHELRHARAVLCG